MSSDVRGLRRRKLAALAPDVIVADGHRNPSRAATEATRTIPIVFVIGQRSGRAAASSRAWRGRAAISPGSAFVEYPHVRKIGWSCSRRSRPRVTRVGSSFESPIRTPYYERFHARHSDGQRRHYPIEAERRPRFAAKPRSMPPSPSSRAAPGGGLIVPPGYFIPWFTDDLIMQRSRAGNRLARDLRLSASSSRQAALMAYGARHRRYISARRRRTSIAS